MGDLDRAYIPGHLVAVGKEPDVAVAQTDAGVQPGTSAILRATHGALVIAFRLQCGSKSCPTEPGDSSEKHLPRTAQSIKCHLDLHLIYAV
jgi:hypothetical protein